MRQQRAREAGMMIPDNDQTRTRDGQRNLSRCGYELNDPASAQLGR